MWFYCNSFNNNPGMTAVHDDVSRVTRVLQAIEESRIILYKEDYTVIHKGRSVMSCPHVKYFRFRPSYSVNKNCFRSCALK